METVRLAMWSGPRNISTAMMRSFENRDDCAVVDEPFYAAYLDATGYDHPAREAVIASQPTDWRAVAQSLCADEPAPVFYQKHMTQHLLADMDLAFTASLTNCFLIRDPRRIVASYAKVRAEFSLAELGFEQQYALFQRESDRLGEVPPVLDAALTLADPESVLRQLCERVGIGFSPSMLRWPAGPRDSDGVWAPHWYGAVWESTGFSSTQAGAVQAGATLEGESSSRDGAALSAPPPVPRLTAEQERLCEVAEGFYRRMREFALEPVAR